MDTAEKYKQKATFYTVMSQMEQFIAKLAAKDVSQITVEMLDNAQTPFRVFWNAYTPDVCEKIIPILQTELDKIKTHLKTLEE